jgi:hypothetical protein
MKPFYAVEKILFALNSFLIVLFCSCSAPSNNTDLSPAISNGQHFDLRKAENGKIIIKEKYVDQPFITILKNKKWICSVTVGMKGEGESIEQIHYLISEDNGNSWSKSTLIEKDTNVSASYSSIFVTKNNRIYVFYTFNGDSIYKLKGRAIRNDMLGWFCFRYSDDEGKNWSKRYRINVPNKKVDIENDWNGKVQMFWTTAKPIISQSGEFFLPFTKIGKYNILNTEGWILHSPNLNTEIDPDNITWNLLPEGNLGISNTELGNVQEEHDIVELSDGTLYCVYRTSKGSPAYTISRNGGRSWSMPKFLLYPNKALVRHPRANIKVWKTSNGKFLLWIHNNNQNIRNPAWLLGGIEKNGEIIWSQPEIVLFSTNVNNNVSGSTIVGEQFTYPDLVESDGRYFIAATQKYVVRLHELDNLLLANLWNQAALNTLVSDDLIWTSNKFDDPQSPISTVLVSKTLPKLNEDGFTIEMRYNPFQSYEGQVLFDNHIKLSDETYRGYKISVGMEDNFVFEMWDGKEYSIFKTRKGTLQQTKSQHVAFTIDGSSNIICATIDGILNDWGNSTNGWTRFSESFSDVNGSAYNKVDEKFYNALKVIRIYNRSLQVSEIISNYNSGK